MPTDENGLRARTEAEAIADIVKKGALAPEFHSIENAADDAQPPVQLVTFPAGVTVLSLKKHLDEFRLNPERMKGTAHLTDLASFIAHVKRFSDDNSVIFADDNRQVPGLMCVINYNEAGPDGEPRFGDHRALYAFPLSDAWVAWTGCNKEWMKLEEFAAFLEEHLVDVTTATGAAAEAFASLYQCKFATPSRLLELSKGLALRVNARVEKHANLATGEGQVVFAEQHEAAGGGPLAIPGAFALAVPVFRNGDAYIIPVRLRYRVAVGSLLWQFDLHRIDATFSDAVRLAAEKAAEQTGRTLLYGRPET
jgi:uncharacterized protein YfdQ (DUF2303 family)